MIAVSVVDYKSREPKNDPDYVRWLPQLVEVVDGVRKEKELKFHSCTDEDF